MKKLINFFMVLLASSPFVDAQNIGIGTSSPAASAKLDISATNAGVLIPRMSQAQRNAIAGPATGLLIYQTDNTTGFYYYNGTGWIQLSAGGATNF